MRKVRVANYPEPGSFIVLPCEISFWRKGLNAENLSSPPSPGKNILLRFPFIKLVLRLRRETTEKKNIPSVPCFPA
jgi:hypothetical protein